MTSLRTQLESVILPQPVMRFSCTADHYNRDRVFSNLDNPVIGAGVHTPAAKAYISSSLSNDGYRFVTF